MPSKSEPFTHCVKINPSYSVSYWLYNNRSTGIKSPFKREIIRHQGTLTKRAMKKLKLCIQWLITISELKTVYSIKENKSFKFRINFITLTLSDKQKHSDEFVKNNMLASFLQWLRLKHNAHSYVWKAEAQKNGNIHFHIATNRFIHWMDVRMKWNSIQQYYGYTSSQEWTNPIKDINSTDIKAVKKVESMTNYMLKYFCKNEADKRKISGRVWAASNNLTRSSIVIDDTSGSYSALLCQLNQKDICDIKEEKRFTLFIYKGKIMKYLPGNVRRLIKAKIAEMRAGQEEQTRIEIESFY